MINRLQACRVFLGNVIQFLSIMLHRRIPIWKWSRAWQLAEKKHQREVRKMLTELTMNGEIKRRMGDDGEFRYYPIDHDID